MARGKKQQTDKDLSQHKGDSDTNHINRQLIKTTTLIKKESSNKAYNLINIFQHYTDTEVH